MASTTDTVQWNISKAATLISLVASLSAVVWTTAVAHDRLARAESRITTIEQKMDWQNEVLWELRGDLKVVKDKVSAR